MHLNSPVVRDKVRSRARRIRNGNTPRTFLKCIPNDAHRNLVGRDFRTVSKISLPETRRETSEIIPQFIAASARARYRPITLFATSSHFLYWSSRDGAQRCTRFYVRFCDYTSEYTILCIREVKKEEPSTSLSSSTLYLYPCALSTNTLSSTGVVCVFVNFMCLPLSTCPESRRTSAVEWALECGYRAVDNEYRGFPLSFAFFFFFFLLGDKLAWLSPFHFFIQPLEKPPRSPSARIKKIRKFKWTETGVT